MSARAGSTIDRCRDQTIQHSAIMEFLPVPGHSRRPPRSGALVWSVAAPDGTILGSITQANTVPAGSLDTDWDEMAPSVAAGAASGIFELVNKLR